MGKVQYKYGTQAQFDGLALKDEDALYFLTDSQRIYKGEKKISSSDVVFSTTVPDVKNTFDGILYVVLKGSKYSMFIKNGDELDEIELGPTTMTDVDYNATAEGDSAVWTFTLSDGTRKTISTPKENFLSSATINEAGVLTLTLSNGDKVEVNMAELIDNTDTVKLTEDIAPVGVTVFGGIPSGGWKKGASLTQILKSLIQREQDAVVVNPRLTLSLSGAPSAVEAGTTVVPTIRASFNKGSYSPGLPADTGVKITEYSLIRTNNGVETTVVDKASDVQNYAEPTGIQIGDGDSILSYKAKYSYSAGAKPTTNMGNESSKPAIAAKSGEVSSALNIAGYRKYFYGATTDKPVIDSAYVRARTASSAGYRAGEITLTVPVGAQRIIIACEASKTGVTKIINTTALNADVTGTFTKKEVEVEGVNGYTAVKYNVWVYEPAVPYGNQAVLKVTLG